MEDKTIKNSPVQKWIIIPDGETVILRVHTRRITKTIRHWNPVERHYEPCYPKMCLACLEGYPKRTRFRTRVLFDHHWYWWEFGKEVNRTILNLAGEDTVIDLLITRLGGGHRTRYVIGKVDHIEYSPGKEG